MRNIQFSLLVIFTFLTLIAMESLKAIFGRIKPNFSQLMEVSSISEHSNMNNDYQRPQQQRQYFESNVSLLWLSVTVDESKREQTSHSWNFKSLIGFKPGQILAIYRWKIWWSIPKLLRDKENGEGNTPPETYLLLGKLPDDNFVVLIPSIDQNMGFSLEGSFSLDVLEKEAFLILHGYEYKKLSSPSSSSSSSSRKAVIIAKGTDPFEIVAEAMNELKRHIRSDLELEENRFCDQIENLFYERGPGPKFADELGWCTWDSFYTDLTSDRVLNGLKSFTDIGIQPKFIILDDGWQGTTVNDRANGYQWFGRLVSFTANFKFSKDYTGESSCSTAINIEKQECIDPVEGILPGSLHIDPNRNGQSLEHLITSSKQIYGIKNFLVWHTLTGYWAGVEPTHDLSSDLHPYDAEITFANLSPSMLRMSKANALVSEPFTTDGVGVVHPEKVDLFFHDYHRLLKTMGVDGVKVDAQSVLPSLTSARGGGWEFTKAFHKALKKSVENNFDHHKEFPIIHCMCHSQGTLLAIAALYSCQGNFPSYLRPIIRGSDDFWPFNSASHGPHIYANTINSILFSTIGLHDWDMFQTSLGKPSELHAVSRAISGGPVYVSDRPKEQNVEIFKKITFPNGKIPRCIQNALPSPTRLFDDPQRKTGVPLIVHNINRCGGLVVAAFSITGAILENDLDGFRHLLPEEIEWTIEPSSLSEVNSSIPVYEQSILSDYLHIHTNITFMDISNYLRQKNINTLFDGKNGYIAIRYSDKALFFMNSSNRSEDSSHSSFLYSVPIYLQNTFDFDIITMAPILSFSTKQVKNWISVLGAIDMYNSGGAVKSIVYLDNITNHHESNTLSVSLLGTGRYWFISKEVITVTIQNPMDSGVTITTTIKESNISNQGKEDERVFVTEVYLDLSRTISNPQQNLEESIILNIG